MNSPFHAVARGLRLAHVGFLITCLGAISATVLSWFVGQVGWRDDLLRTTLWVAFWLNVLIGVGGAITGIVGRVKCLMVPPEFPAVRGRATAAVVLEASGWFSGVVGVGVGVAMGYKWLPPHFWVPSVGGIVSGLVLVCGRILFLRFLRVLARVVGDKTTGRRARWSLLLFILDWAVGLIGVGLSAAGGMLNLYELTAPLVAAVWTATGMSGLAGLVLYDRVLGDLAKSVYAFADSNPEDEEERRYRARGGEEEDAAPEFEPVEEE